MKILIVSDTHGRTGNLEAVLEKEKNLDYLIHLGDVEGKEDYIRALVPYGALIIGGNNDYFSDLPREVVFSLGNHKVFATHGHSYRVSMGLERLKTEAKRRGADLAMYGHTHVPFIETEGGFTVLNPGSLTYPRQSGRVPSYIIMEIDKEGKTTYEIRYL